MVMQKKGEGKKEVEKEGGNEMENENKLGNTLNGAARVLTYIAVAGAAFLFLGNFAKTDRLQIEHNRSAIIAIQLKVDKGEGDHAFGLEKTAAISEKFKEVETQFANLDERTKRIEERFAREIAAMDGRLQKEFASELSRLRELEAVMPRLAVVENYLMWLKRKIQVVPPERIVEEQPSSD